MAWADEEGQPVRQAVEKALRTLAEYIADEALFLTEASLPPQTTSDVRPRAFAYSLYSEYPAIQRTFFLGKDKAGTTFLKFSPVDSLRPSLRWENLLESAWETDDGMASSATPTYE